MFNQERRIYAFSFFYMFLVLIPVIIPFFQSFGLSMQEIFLLQAIFGIGVVISEVPTGYIADIYGRKKTMVLGAICCFVGFSGFVVGNNFWHFSLAEIILSVGTAFVSGSDSAMLYDSLPKDDRKKTANAFANLQLSQQSGESVAALLGGFLAIYSLKWAAVGQVIAAFLVIFFALGLKEETRNVSKNHNSNFKRVFKEIFVGDAILRLTFINSVVWGLSTFIAVWTYQKHWQELRIPLVFFGILWATYNIVSGLSGKGAHWLEHKMGARVILLLMAGLVCVGYFGLAFAPGYTAIAFGLCHYISRGINGVIMNDAMNWRLNSDFRATSNSLKSFAFRLGFAIIGPGVGYLIDARSLKFTYASLGLVFLAMIPLVLWPLIRAIEGTGKSEIPQVQK